MENTFHASVSLIRIKGSANELDDEIVFIKRALCDGDPWSGHCAFPGGGFEKSDLGLRETAIRETKEEVGLELKRSDFKEFICTVKPKKKFNNRSLNLHCYEFEHDAFPTFFDASEVAEVFSVRVSDFFKEQNYQYLEVIEGKQTSLCYIHDRRFIIWGLTLGILLEYLLKKNVEKTQCLSFFSEYQVRKNSMLDIDLTENISIGGN